MTTFGGIRFKQVAAPSALITRAYLPILLIGTVGGLAVGVAYVLVY